MSLWLRARRAPLVAFAGVSVVGLVALTGQVVIPMPGLFNAAGLAVPIALVLPLLLSTALALGLAGGNISLEAAAARPVLALDVIFVLVAAGSAVAGLFLIDGPHHLGAAAARNVLGYVGLYGIGRRVFGEAAGATLPVAALLVMAAFGADASGHPRSWAWLLADGLDLRAFTVASLIWLAGTVGLGTSRSRLVRR